MIEVGTILVMLASVPIPIGFIEYPCPQEYKIDQNILQTKCIVKVDYEN